MRWIVFFALSWLALPCMALEQMGDFKITIAKTYIDAIFAIIDNTQEGYRIRCALYNADGTVIGVEQRPSRELGTTILFENVDPEKVTSYKCIKLE